MSESPEAPKLSAMWRVFVEGLVATIQGGLDDDGVPTKIALSKVFQRLEIGARLANKDKDWILRLYARIIAALYALHPELDE